MREIKFRGKDVDSGKWVYGFYFQLNGSEYIIEEGTGYFDISHGEVIFATAYCHEIEEGTVGQCTGLKDKHGKEIYKGDIVKYTWRNFHGRTVTEMIPVTWGSYSDGGEYVDNVECWMIRHNSLSDICDNKFNQLVEVVGNIYENPELLEG